MSLLMIFAASLAADVSPPAEANPPPQVMQRAERMGVFDIPDEIAAAVLPYMMCQNASRGIEVRNEGGKLAPIVAKGADCAPFRLKATKDAEAMLKRQGVPKKKRKTFVETTFASMDDHQRRMDEMMKAIDAPN